MSMNPEILHMGRLTLWARRFLKSGIAIDPHDDHGITRLTFHVRGKYFGIMPYDQKLEGLNQWLDYLVKKNCVSVYLILPDEIDEHDDLSLYASFLNSNSAWMMVTNTPSDFSIWNRHWRQSPGQGWEIDYYEKAAPGRDPLQFEVNFDPKELPTVLADIKLFAGEIGCPRWVERFERTESFLSESHLSSVEPQIMLDFEDLLPPEKKHFLQCLSLAWVFGGNCSWNDEAQTAARAQDRKKDYQCYTWALYRAIMRGLMFCFNDSNVMILPNSVYQSF